MEANETNNETNLVTDNLIDNAKKQEELNTKSYHQFDNGDISVEIDNPYDKTYGIDYDREIFGDGCMFKVATAYELCEFIEFIKHNIKFHTKAMADTGNEVHVNVWPSNTPSHWIAEVRIRKPE